MPASSASASRSRSAASWSRRRRISHFGPSPIRLCRSRWSVRSLTSKRAHRSSTRSSSGEVSTSSMMALTSSPSSSTGSSRRSCLLDDRPSLGLRLRRRRVGRHQPTRTTAETDPVDWSQRRQVDVAVGHPAHRGPRDQMTRCGLQHEADGPPASREHRVRQTGDDAVEPRVAVDTTTRHTGYCRTRCTRSSRGNVPDRDPEPAGDVLEVRRDGAAGDRPRVVAGVDEMGALDVVACRCPSCPGTSSCVGKYQDPPTRGFLR